MGIREHQGRTELRKAALRRLRDARSLLDSGREHAHCAMYVAGYAVECKLKAIAMEIHNCHTLAELSQEWDVDDREVFTHGLEAFAKRMSLWNRLTLSDVWRDFSSQVNRWRPSWRYKPGESNDSIEGRAKAFIDAVQRVYNWLDANRG